MVLQNLEFFSQECPPGTFVGVSFLFGKGLQDLREILPLTVKKCPRILLKKWEGHHLLSMTSGFQRFLNRAFNELNVNFEKKILCPF